MTVFYVYILECNDGSLYTGWTNNVQERLKKHNEGKAAKYTRSRRPAVLKYVIEFPTQREAMQCEYMLKRLTREQKLAFIASNTGDASYL